MLPRRLLLLAGLLPLLPHAFCAAPAIAPREVARIDALLASVASAPVGPAPNIVLVLADDLGWNQLGALGHPTQTTPVLDRLIGQGMVFSNAYANGGNCAPSRACLLSGQLTPRHEVYAVESTKRGPAAKMRLEPVPNKNGLKQEVVTIADALKSAGYTTAHFGKWHLWDPRDGALPSRQGFDVTYDSFGDGQVEEGTESNKPGPPGDPKGVFALTGKACEFIAAQPADRPFFIYLAHHATHGPLQGRPEDIAALKAKGLRGTALNLAACTLALDRSVGMLVEALEKKGAAKNTLLLFTSDNGGAFLSQEPLRGAKGCYYEGGIRVPMLAVWPGRIAPGGKCEWPVQLTDLYPTILGLADGRPVRPEMLDGVSLLPVLTGASPRARALFWHFPGYLDKAVERGRQVDVRDGFRTRPVTVIRKGHWKLHLFHEEWMLDGGRAAVPANHAVELYDLSADPGERSDLAATNPEMRDALLDELLQWMQSSGAKFAMRR